MTPRPNRERLARFTREGDPLYESDVLTAEEMAEDRGYLSPRPSQQPPDPALVGIVASLQAGGGLDG
jgi:hypothetical protein